MKDGGRAIAEFQNILDHRGEAPASPLYPLAHLGLARAAVLTGDTARARKAYDSFLELWADADRDLQFVREARQEQARLQ